MLENVRCDRDLIPYSNRFRSAPTPRENHSLLARVLSRRIVGTLAYVNHSVFRKFGGLSCYSVYL